ncbi:hypothetical protein M440DRAFT_1398301 [Trichoderma longibrachiatum ATCC 18648]|uniref:Uncharacterized protein n=1 Tax=Trichoderma longibrachiatum ATCC 18648 TaxID=983965 RepID=A0A2T4CBW2_TRILO|nr:hypothetical protein M440DRAFT_1398301 [Trichoderma longibrachiatum ATCC 18648]
MRTRKHQKAKRENRMPRLCKRKSRRPWKRQPRPQKGKLRTREVREYVKHVKPDPPESDNAFSGTLLLSALLGQVSSRRSKMDNRVDSQR